MKEIVYFLGVIVFFCSCNEYGQDTNRDIEEIELITENLILGSLQKILDGYFVTAIAFDSKGNAWIGTFGQGVIRYNTKETIFYDDDNSGVPKGLVIWDIAVDKNDNVWIACDGLLKYDGKEFTLYNSRNTAMPEDVVSSIVVDSQNNVWFTSCRFRQGGLVKYDGSKWKVYTPNNSALPDNLINAIAVDQSDNVWLTVNENLVTFSGDKWKIFDKNDLGFTNSIFAGIQFNSKNQLLGINDHSFNNLYLQPPAEFYIFDGKKTTLKTFINNVTSIPGQTKITIDHNDNVWCFGAAADCGVLIGNRWKKIDFLKHVGSRVSVYTIEENDNYQIWIGTSDGIYILNN